MPTLFPAKSPVSRTTASLAVALALAASQGAAAAIIAFTNEFVWNAFAASADAQLWTETFDAPGPDFPGPLCGSVGGVLWCASASGGVCVSAGALRPCSPEPLTFTFSGAPVGGVAGNIFGTDGGLNVVPSIVQLSLQDGTSYIGFVDAAAAFVGFYSTGAAITGMTISAQPLPGGTSVVYPTIDNLTFAVVPAPGAFALLGLSALACRRRR